MKFLLEGIGLGLATGVYCLGGCLPLLLPHFLSERRDWRDGIWTVFEFMLGRLTAYLALGALFGLAGTYAKGISGVPIAPILLTLAGALLLAGGVVRTFPNAALCRRLGGLNLLRRLPLVAGLLLGVNLCPPFMAGLSAAVAYASVYGGIMLFAGFFLASSVYLVPVPLIARISVFKRLQDVSRAFAILAGFYFVVQGLSAVFF